MMGWREIVETAKAPNEFTETKQRVWIKTGKKLQQEKIYPWFYLVRLKFVDFDDIL